MTVPTPPDPRQPVPEGGEKECFSTRCRCCVCQGKHCLMPHPGHSCADEPTSDIFIAVCGGAQARICPKTGKEHDMSAFKLLKDGGSVACKDCGITAMQIDLMELP